MAMRKFPTKSSELIDIEDDEEFERVVAEFDKLTAEE